MKIRKTIIQVTILHPIDDDVDGASLADIGYQIDEGSWLGQSKVLESTPVLNDQVEAECLALGNDGLFFAEAS